MIGDSKWPLAALKLPMPRTTSHCPQLCPPQPGVGTGTLPLCQSVMRFLLGCLDRKFQPEDAKSLSKPQQPPAPAQPRAYRGVPAPAPTVLLRGHQHQLHPGAPTAMLGVGQPWDMQSRGFSTYLSHWPLSQPMLALMQPPCAQAGGARLTLGDPKLHASTVPTLLSFWVPASASHC